MTQPDAIRRKKVLYVHHGAGLGGAPISLLFLIQKLDRSLYEPHVLCLEESPAADLYRKENVPTHVARGIHSWSHTTLLWSPLWRPVPLARDLCRFPLSVKRARRILMEMKPGILHLNSTSLIAWLLAARGLGIRTVLHAREPLNRGHLGVRRAFFQKTIRNGADAVVSICECHAEPLRPSNRIKIVYNFVDFQTFDRSLDGNPVRMELGVGPDEKAIVMLGGVDPNKGTDIFIRAAENVLKRRGNYRFFVAGKTSETPPGEAAWLRLAKDMVHTLRGAPPWYYRRAVRMTERAAGGGKLRLLGVRSDIPRLLAACDLLVFPSRTPHFARPIIEAAAMGKPSVASDLGGPRELIVHGETGLLTPPLDPAALADAMIDILDDPRKAARMGEAAWRFAKEHFDAERNARATFEVYDPSWQGGESLSGRS